MALTAGLAQIDISPRKPLFLVGYPHVQRTSTGVHDPLLATALALDEGNTRLLIITVDVLSLTGETTDACRQELNRRTGIPAENIMISATHTHSAPVTARILAWQDDPVVPPPDPDYMKSLQTGIVKAGCQAYTDRTPTRLAITSAHIDGVGGNRLAADGIYDPEAGIVAIADPDGTIRGVQVVYSMHPTVLHEDSTLVSADFPHYTRQAIRRRYPSATVLYHTGPCGNLSPRYHVNAQTFAEAERLGNHLGEQILTALDGLHAAAFNDDITLAADVRPVSLPPRHFPSVVEAETMLKEARQSFNRLQEDNAAHGPLRTAECTVFGAEERVTLARAQASGELAALRRKYSSVDVQVLRIGSVHLVGLPGECFVEYSLAIKERAPGQTFVISLANGELQGYIVTPEASGYEAGLSLFLPEAGQRLVSTALDGIEELSRGDSVST